VAVDIEEYGEEYGSVWSAAPSLVAKLLLESSPQAVAVVDSDRVVRGWSRGAERILGWRSVDVVGRRDPSVPEQHQGDTNDVLVSLLAGGSVGMGRVLRRVRPDGNSVSVVMTAAVPTDVDGERHLAIFFRPASTDEELLERRRRLSRNLVDTVREDEVVSILSDALRDILGASGGAVLARCEPGQHLHGVRSLGGWQEDAEQVELDLSVSGTAWDLAARGTVGFDAAGPEGLGNGGPTMFVPMGPRGEGRVLAVWFDTVPDEPALVPVARAVADEAWLALQRAELVGELEGKVEILEATAAVAAMGGLDLDSTVRAVALRASSALSCERAAVYLRDADGDLTLAAMHATDLAPDDEVGLRMAAEVLARGEAVLVQDASTCVFADGPWHREHGAVSVLGLPMRVGPRDVGVLVVAHTDAHPRGFTSLCTQVGAAVAQQAALAIEHARLYAAERQTVRELTELDELKREYIAGLTHDLRTPLTGLLGFVKTLHRFGDSVSREDQRRYLSTMERQAGQLVELVEEMLVTAQIDAGEQPSGRTERVELEATVSDALALYGPDAAERIRRVGSTGHALVDADAGQLRRVVHNLVDNALRHAADLVEVHLAVEGDLVTVSVCDDGPGVDAADVDRIFERFQRGSSTGPIRRGALGLGLHIGRTVARAHGGDLVYEDRPGGGACFVLSLPVAAAVAAAGGGVEVSG
jgi:PAS domain S-box-containing protein